MIHAGIKRTEFLFFSPKIDMETVTHPRTFRGVPNGFSKACLHKKERNDLVGVVRYMYMYFLGFVPFKI
jgi:hypothetical protein